MAALGESLHRQHRKEGGDSIARIPLRGNDLPASERVFEPQASFANGGIADRALSRNRSGCLPLFLILRTSGVQTAENGPVLLVLRIEVLPPHVIE